MSRQQLERLADLMIPNDFDRNLPSGSCVDLEAILRTENKSDDATKSAEQFSDLVFEKLNKSLESCAIVRVLRLIQS
jgi:hypothetical protein